MRIEAARVPSELLQRLRRSALGRWTTNAGKGVVSDGECTRLGCRQLQRFECFRLSQQEVRVELEDVREETMSEDADTVQPGEIDSIAQRAAALR